MLSFSTSWNSERGKPGTEIVQEILDLGFDAIELGHGLSASAVHEMLELQKKNPFVVSSLHNFCPLPPEVMVDQPDCYEFTSDRASDRERAVRLTLQTIDMAERFEASTVVIHTGRIRPLKVTAALREFVENGKFLSKEFARAKLEAVKRRESLGEAYVRRVVACLSEIVPYAAKKRIRIGIENREHYEAVPSEREFEGFLRLLDSPYFGYWHDFGHAQIKQNLALLDHSELLDRLGRYAIGCHIHDVKWPFEDHCPPFTGEIPYAKLVPKLPKNCIFVFELRPRIARAQIAVAADRWRELFLT
jgi:sugar phosphate isomerase/epimerase